MPRIKMTLEEYRAAAAAQGVARNDYAGICPVCRTVQSMNSLIAAGVKPDDVDSLWSVSCIGRFTNAGEHRTGTPPGRGCNWTLYGLFHLHELEVETPEGGIHFRFALATPEQAQKLAADLAGPAEPGNEGI